MSLSLPAEPEPEPQPEGSGELCARLSGIQVLRCAAAWYYAALQPGTALRCSLVLHGAAARVPHTPERGSPDGPNHICCGAPVVRARMPA